MKLNYKPILDIGRCLQLLLLFTVPVLPAWTTARESATPAIESISPSTPQPADIEAFVRKGCPHCEQAKAFLADLSHRQPALRIVLRDVQEDPTALSRLKQLAERAPGTSLRVPAFWVGGQLIVGYSEDAGTSGLIISSLTDHTSQPATSPAGASSCEAEESLECKPEPATPSGPKPETFDIDFLGHRLALDDIGLPAFTLAMGLLDGFNPCSMWVLLLMISLLAPMQDRWRMLAIAGTFVAVEGIAYFIFMAAWLNLFLFIGLSRLSEIVIATIALTAGMINLKDFWAFGRGPSLSIPKSAKPGIYARIRRIIQAENMVGALIGVVVLGILVQIVEFVCTSGFPALFTRILTLHRLEGASYYGYLLLYNLAYMLDDVIILGLGVITLSQHRLQEREGRWLKLLSGAVMVGLAVYLFWRPGQ